MWPTTWRSETSTRPRLQSTRLRSGREPRPGPGRRTRPRGKQGWALFQQGEVQPCSLCSFLVEPWKADSGYCFAVIPRGWGVLGVRWAAAEAPRCQQALRGPEATEPWSLGWAEPAAEPSPPQWSCTHPSSCSGSYLRDSGLTETDKAIHERLSSSGQGRALVAVPRLRPCSCCLWSRDRLALGHRHTLQPLWRPWRWEQLHHNPGSYIFKKQETKCKMSFKSRWCLQCVNMRIPLMGQFVRKCYINVIFHLYDNQIFWHFSVLPKITLLFWDWNVTIDNSTQCILKLHKIDFSNFSYGLFIHFIINLCRKTAFSWVMINWFCEMY